MGKIEMLKKEKKKIDDVDFDLEAWKSSATTLIARIFGENDPRIRSIDQLRIDYGSWALRDASSKYDPVATCKRKAHDIMEMSIDELQTPDLKDQSKVLDLLADELTGAQMKDIKAALGGAKGKKGQTDLIKKLQSLKAPILAKVLASLMIE